MEISDSISSSEAPIEWEEETKLTPIFQAASYLTDPICKSHEYFRWICLVDPMYPKESPLMRAARKGALVMGLIGWAGLACLTTLPGIALRYIANRLSDAPYTYLKGNDAEKVLPLNGTFTLLSWNICGVSAGYSISDGGVYPWQYRINALTNKILEKDADIVCLYEVFDINTSMALYERMKEKGYVHFYFNMGPMAVGVNSGLFVASKYRIENPEFTRFPVESLVGRTKNCSKGVFAFGLPFARIFTTHPQNSEEPAFPTPEEIEGRRQQMELIDRKVAKVRDRCVIVTGDLNLDDDEYHRSSWSSRYIKGDIASDKKTWGGDQFCAELVEQKVSDPLNLDHTLLVKNSAQSIENELVETGYDPQKFSLSALSDHEGILSTITLS